MIISITGTPGTGKTTVSEAMRLKGYVVTDLNKYITDNGLLGKYDEERDTHDVDIPKLKRSLAHHLNSKDTVFVEGHLSHFLDSDIIIVLRCDPSVLYKRLKDRGYAEKKIIENVQAEVLDVILCESVDTERPVCEIDCSYTDTNNIISALEDILEGNTEGYLPGSVNWQEEMEKWF